MAKRVHRGIYGLLFLVSAPLAAQTWYTGGSGCPLSSVQGAVSGAVAAANAWWPPACASIGLSGSGQTCDGGGPYYSYTVWANCAPCSGGREYDYLGACVCPVGEEWDGEECVEMEPCVEPWSGDPGACECLPPNQMVGDQCEFQECTHEMPYLEAETGVAPGTIGCNGGCAYRAVSTVVIDPDGSPSSSTQMAPTGEKCVAYEPAPDPIVGAPDPTQCVSDDAGNSICVDGEGPSNCGTFNGEFVCIPPLADNTCASTPSGAIFCVGGAEPDSGWDGTPEAPTSVPPAAFAWSGRPEPSGGWGVPGGPSEPGELWPPGSETGGRLFPGGAIPPGDDTPASDSPDPDLPVADPEELVDEVDEPTGGASGALTWGVPETGTCPAPTAIEMFGNQVLLEWDPACNVMDLIRPFVIAFGAVNALMILMHFGR